MVFRNSFDIFGFAVYYYGVILAAGILTAFLVGLLLFKLVGYNEEIAYMLFFICVPLGIFCARLYYVVFYDPEMFSSFFALRDGGIAIYGGIIGGALGVLIVSRIKKVGYFTLCDMIVVGLILAQSIGRWGNYVNQEAYGFAVPAHVPPFTVDIDGSYHLATFFYESILNLIGFCVMMTYYVIKMRRKKYVYGTGTAIYFIWYGITRMIVEPMRMDSLLLFGSSTFVLNRVSFVLSIALVAVGVILYWAATHGKISQENKACLKKPNK
jgi:phosphatidylglycerol:prolipoprotein diacylglycerol transferase